MTMSSNSHAPAHPAAAYPLDVCERTFGERPDLARAEVLVRLERDLSPVERRDELLKSFYGRTGGSALDRVLVARWWAELDLTRCPVCRDPQGEGCCEFGACRTTARTLVYAPRRSLKTPDAHPTNEGSHAA